jgi:hypothetical protein
MYIINEFLATDGIGEDDYPQKKLVPLYALHKGFHVVDVRNLKDEGGNKLIDYVRAIFKVSNGMAYHNYPIVVCCGAGQSRSCAIALGVLVEEYCMDFFDAWELVKQKVPICNIDPSHIAALKQIYGVTIP